MMTLNRAVDPQPQARFRSGRVTNINGEFYFATREGTLEGPFLTRTAAENEAALYVDAVKGSEAEASEQA